MAPTARKTLIYAHTTSRILRLTLPAPESGGIVESFYTHVGVVMFDALLDRLLRGMGAPEILPSTVKSGDSNPIL